MGNEDVLQVRGISPEFRVEVESAGCKAPRIEDHQHGFCSIQYVCGELVRVPAVLGVPYVCVDASQKPRVGGGLKLMTETVACQGGVVRLYVEFKVLLQSMGPKEADDRRGVVVVLVFCRFHGLRFYQEGTFKPDASSVVLRLFEEDRHVLDLPLHIRVPEASVSLTAAPEHIVFSSKLNGGF